MSERWLLVDFVTGVPLRPLPVLASSSWSARAGYQGQRWSVDQSVTADVSLDDPVMQVIEDEMLPWRHAVVVEIDGALVAGGPIFKRTVDLAARRYTIHAAGGSAYFEHREMIPRAVADHGFVLFDEAAKDVPAYARLTMDGGPYTWKSIAEFGVDRMMQWWPNSPRIWFYPTLEAGTHTLSVDAIDHKRVSDWLEEISASEDGIQWDVRPGWDESRSTVTWWFMAGSPSIVEERPTWDASSVLDLQVTADGSNMVTHQHVTGGRDGDRPLSVTRVQDGPIMLEHTERSHFDIDDPAVLREIAFDKLGHHYREMTSLAFSVPASEAALFRQGDLGTLMAPDVPHIRGKAVFQVLSRSASAGDDFVRIDATGVDVL